MLRGLVSLCTGSGGYAPPKPPSGPPLSGVKIPPSTGGSNGREAREDHQNQG
jgi:hypothetical protein